MQKNNKNNRGVLVYLLMLAALLSMASFVFTMQDTAVEYKYSDIIQMFEDGKVEDYIVNLGSGDLSIKLRGSAEDEPRLTYRVPNTTYFINMVHPIVTDYNEAHPESRITYEWKRAAEWPIWANMALTVVLIAAMGALWYYTMRQTRSGGGIGNFSKVKPRPAEEGRRVTFGDVAGAQEEKQELEELVEFLKNPGKYNLLGARIPKGVLLVGPPGTGKTLLARAVAGEAGVPFFSMSGSDFVEMFVGVGASRVRDLFDQAKRNAPSIIFIDEIDAVGRHRGAGLGGGHDEREQTLNQLLVEMDGFSSNTGVIIIAATNRRDILDPALLRPGRFDRQVVVNYPDVEGREQILLVHTRNKPIAPDVDFKVIARTTAGFTGADLENIMNEAALLAARQNKKAITMTDVQDATIKVVMGPEKKSKVITEKDKRLTAYHEAGHAVVTYYMTTKEKVHQISIIPRGMAGGYTMSLPTEDKAYQTRTQLYEDIVVLMGGRVAEALVLEDISTGASSDLERSSQLARAMVTRYGFSDKLGPIVYGQNPNEVFLGRSYGQSPDYSQVVAGRIDDEVHSLIDKAYQHAVTILKERMDKLHLVSQALLEFEKLEASDFEKLMTGETINPEKTFTVLPTTPDEPKDDVIPPPFGGDPQPPVPHESRPNNPAAPESAGDTGGDVPHQTPPYIPPRDIDQP